MTTTPPDVGLDNAQPQSDAVEELRILLPSQIGRYDNDEYQACLLRAYAPEVLNRLSASESRVTEQAAKIAALEAELAALKGKATESDRECAESLADRIEDECLDTSACEMGCFPDFDMGKTSALIAAHVASRLAPVEAHLRHCVDTIQWMSGSSDFSPEGQAHVGWQKMFPGYAAARAFLAASGTENTTEGEGM